MTNWGCVCPSWNFKYCNFFDNFYLNNPGLENSPGYDLDSINSKMTSKLS